MAEVTYSLELEVKDGGVVFVELDEGQTMDLYLLLGEALGVHDDKCDPEECCCDDEHEEWLDEVTDAVMSRLAQRLTDTMSVEE